MTGHCHYDRDADIAWFPTGESDDVVSERVPGGLHDYDRSTRQLVAIEVWNASTRLPADLLQALPRPAHPDDAAPGHRSAPKPEPRRRGPLPEPLKLPGDPQALSRALEEIRGGSS